MSDEILKRFVGSSSHDNCEKCDYKGGFHVVLHPALPAQEGEVGLRLKCPNCGQEYDFGLRVVQTEGWH